ncbi:MAG: hypothetical protein ACRC68_11025 [Clostridium sp.]
MGVLLIIIGVLLVLLNVKAIRKEENSFSSILKREESTTNRDYDTHIISIRKDLAESILDIQKEMEEIKESIANIRVIEKKTENVEEKKEMDDIINNDIIASNDFSEETVELKVKVKEAGVISDINFENTNTKLSKVEEVNILVKKGLSDEEICEKMSIGKGEVLLIKGLFKN